MNNIEWLAVWYKQNCDGQWEHSYGIKIETLDNPGWSVSIDLHETKFSNLSMPELSKNKGDEGWIVCSIKNERFEGFGDGLKLNEIIGVFRDCIRCKFPSRK